MRAARKVKTNSIIVTMIFVWKLSFIPGSSKVCDSCAITIRPILLIVDFLFWQLHKRNYACRNRVFSAVIIGEMILIVQINRDTSHCHLLQNKFNMPSVAMVSLRTCILCRINTANCVVFGRLKAVNKLPHAGIYHSNRWWKWGIGRDDYFPSSFLNM